MSSTSSGPSNSTTANTNPLSPLSPFPSTPNRLPYHSTTDAGFTSTSTPTSSTPSTTENHNHNTRPHLNLRQNTNTSNLPDHNILHQHEHLSPTKAAATTRLNHEISTLTSWLEGLFPDGNIPNHIHPSRWKHEVLAAEQGIFDGPVLASFEGNLGFSQHQQSSHNQCNTQPQPQFANRPPTHSYKSPITPTNPPTSYSTTSTTSPTPLDLLKQLKQINLSSDHLATLLHESRLEQLRHLQLRAEQVEKQRVEGARARLLLDEVFASLTPDAVDAVRSLGEAGVTLGLGLNLEGQGQGLGDVDGNLAGLGIGHITGDGPGTGTTNTTHNQDLTTLYARAILHQLSRKFTLEEQIRDLSKLQDQIKSRLDSSQTSDDPHGIATEDTEDHQTEHFHTQTAQFNRDTKQINLKIMEYHDRVTSLERQLAGLRTGSTSLEDVLNARARIEERRLRVKALQERFAAFNGLPPDLEESRNEVRRAMTELESLKRRREGLFERMGTG